MSTNMRRRLVAAISLLLLNHAAAQFCISSTEQLMQEEAKVTDMSVVRTYTLCGRSRTQLSRLDFSFDLSELGKQGPIQLNPNMHLKCGEDGKIENGCWFIGGDIQVDASNVLENLNTLENVVIEGFTFIGATRYSIWANKAGDITFKNCEWRNHVKTLAPVLMDYFDGRSNSVLKMSFIDCEFKDNTYFGAGSNTAIIYSNGGQNQLFVDRTVFSNNDMMKNNTMAATRSFVIESLGPVEIRDSCFLDNKVGVANIGSFGNSIVSTNGYINQQGAGIYCPYIAAYMTYEQFVNNSPLCQQFTASSCFAQTTRPPTAVPTLQPSAMPTVSPTPGPTMGPTITPMPTDPPVESTPQPTSMPVETSSGPRVPIAVSLIVAALGAVLIG